MRTTLNLDDDVLDRARDAARRLQAPFKRIVNEALREGLKNVEKKAQSRPYRTQSRAMGLKPGLTLDNIQDLLEQAEGAGHR